MAADSELANLYVSFTAKGSQALNKQIDSKRSRLVAAATAAVQFGRNLATAADMAAQRLGGVASKALAVGAALTGGLVAKGLSGTREAETMGNAFSLLGRAVADIAAPAVRALTQAVIEVAGWLISLDRTTKDSILQWSLFTAGVLGAVAIMPKLVAGIKLVSSAVSLMMSKWVAIPALILGVATAIIYLSGEGDTFEERMVSGVGNVAKAWVGFKAVMGGVWSFFKSVMSDMWERMKKIAAGEGFGGDFAGTFKKASEEADKAFNDIMAKQYFQTEKKARNIAQEIANITKSIMGGEGGGGFLSGIGDILGITNALRGFFSMPAIQRIATAWNDKRPVQVEHKFNLQSLQSSWEQLQKTMVASNDQQRQIEIWENIRRGIGDLVNLWKGGLNIKGGVVR